MILLEKGVRGGRMLSMFQKLSRLATYGDAEAGAGAPLGGCLASLCLPNRTPGWVWPSPSKSGCHSKWVHFHESTDPSASGHMPALPSSCSASRSLQLTHTFACMLTWTHTHTHDTNTWTHGHVNMCTHIHTYMHTQRHTCMAVFLH